MIVLTELDNKLLENFRGYVVKKDLVRQVKVGANVPVFVLEYLIANSCSTDDEQKINDYLDKNHDYYIWGWNFKKENNITNWLQDEELSENYEPYVFYYDQVREFNALKYTDDVDYVVEDCGFIRVSQGLPFVYRSMVHIPNPFLMPVVKKRAKKYGFDMLDNNPIDVVKNSKVPICVVHGDMDRAVSVECAKELGTVMKNPKSRVEIYEGRDHAYSICDKERYTRMLSDFLDEMFVFPVEQEEEHGK